MESLESLETVAQNLGAFMGCGHIIGALDRSAIPAWVDAVERAHRTSPRQPLSTWAEDERREWTGIERCARALGAAFRAQTAGYAAEEEDRDYHPRAAGYFSTAEHFQKEAVRELTALKNARAAQRRISGTFASPLRRAAQLVEDCERAGRRPVIMQRLAHELSMTVQPLLSAIRGLELEGHDGPDTLLGVSESAVARARGEVLRLLSEERTPTITPGGK